MFTHKNEAILFRFKGPKFSVKLILFRASVDMEKDKLAQEAADKKFQNFVMKQEQTLRVSIYLLLNLSEDIKV